METNITSNKSTPFAGEDGGKLTSSGISLTSSKTRVKEDEVSEAVEQRRLWAMAATSAAHLITGLTDKPIPNLDAIKKTFAPTTPSEWLRRKEASEAASLVPDTEEGFSTETEVQTELLFYDIDANDDDLRAFLGSSDQDMLPTDSSDRKSSGNVIANRSLPGPSKVLASQKVIQSARKSLNAITTKRLSSDDKEIGSPKQSKSVIGIKKGSGGSVEDPVSGERLSTEQRTKSNEQRYAGTDRDSVGVGPTFSRSSVLGAVTSQSGSGINIDEDDWGDLYDEKLMDDDTTDQNDIDKSYKVAAVDIDFFEISAGLEGLLEDLQLESRITERYKYMLINKFGILLQALMTSQEREYEVIDHLQTKQKILNILQQFLQTEVELSSKAIITEEKNENDQEQGMVLDFHARKSGDSIPGTPVGDEVEGTDKHKSHTDNQGLSIEEMSAATIRDTLLQQRNRLDVLEAIKRIHAIKLKQKEFEKTLLTLHYSKMVKPADLQKEIKEARRIVNDLQIENSSMHHEMGLITTEVKIEDKIVSDEEKIVERLELEALTKQNEVAILQNKPIHVQKEADREAQKLEQLQDMHDNLCQKFMEGMDSFKTFQNKIDKLNTELGTLIRDENKLAAQKKTSVRETERLMAQMEALLTREHIMLDRSAVIQEKIAQATKMKKKIHDEQQRLINEANKALRTSQKLERSIKMSNESYINSKLAHEKMRAAFDAAKPNEDQNSWQKLSRMLEREIVNIKTSLVKRLEESTIKSTMVDKLKLKLNELYDEQVKSGRDLQDLIRTTVRKRRERQEKSEQCIKLDGQIQRFDQDIKFRELTIEDCKRSEKDLFKQIEVYKHKSSILKLERSTIMNEVVLNKHKLSEAHEALKILEADIDSLNQGMLVLDKELKGKHYMILNARLARDSIRNDAFRSRDKFRYYRNQKNELLLGNKTLRRELERQKKDLVEIKINFERALSESNLVAIKVRERIEEICTFNEYIHAYDKILLRGASEITIRELERTKLNSLHEELRKHVLIVKMNQPDESTFFSKIEKLRNEFYDITDRRRKLELELNEDENPKRVHEINFNLMKTRENIPALEDLLDKKEELLATRDAIGLERTLMENHISQITDDCLTRAIFLKDEYTDMIKSKLSLEKQIDVLSKQIDGFLCEASIAEVQAEKGEMKFLEFRKFVTDAELKVAKGLPPTIEIMNEWQDVDRKRKFLLESYQRPGGFYRKVNHKSGTEIQAARLKNHRRILEEPKSSILGWNFSAVNNISNTTDNMFQKSTLNPRQSKNTNRNPRKLSINKPISTMFVNPNNVNF